MMQHSGRVLYLAGGFRTGWQVEVHTALNNFNILDPSTHHIQEAKDYTDWDLAAIRRCDFVLANMEATNPGGYALALEIGYAKALGKYIVLVDQLADLEVIKYFEMVRHCSDAVFDNLTAALDYLNKHV